MSKVLKPEVGDILCHKDKVHPLEEDWAIFKVVAIRTGGRVDVAVYKYGNQASDGIREDTCIGYVFPNVSPALFRLLEKKRGFPKWL